MANEDLLLRQMPHSLEGEQAVLGSMLIDADCVKDVMDKLRPSDFYLRQNREIFETIYSMFTYAKPIDGITVCEEMQKAGTYDENTTRSYLAQLMEITPTSANVMEYAAIVRDKALLRGVAQAAAEITAMVQEGVGEASEILEAAEQKVYAVRRGQSAQDMVPLRQVLPEVLDRLGEMSESENHLPGLSTGMSAVDQKITGLNKSDLILLAARPGMGKTTFGLAVADQVAQQNGPVLFVSLEMDEEQLAAKRLARAAGIAYDALMMGNLGDEERARAAEWSSKVSQIPVYTNRKPRATVDDIANMARKVKGLKLLVVDYFGLIRTEERAKNRYEAMTKVSGQLKALARKLKVPLLCLAQINRENAQRQDKRPQLSDLRDTGALEQDADGVIFLHCNSYYNQERPDPWEPDYMQIILAKNRHASTGTCDAAFYRAVGRIIPAR